MRNILYWSFLILIAVLLAYATPFGLYHLVFLAGGFLLLAGHAVAGRRRGGPSGVSVLGSLLVWVVVYWTTIGLFSNVKEVREFRARYEPYVQQGDMKGYVFYYVDHPGFYELIDSADLNKVIEEQRPTEMRMAVELVRDFGRLRAYTVRGVNGIAVDQEWTSGKPPWEVFRKAPGSSNISP